MQRIISVPLVEVLWYTCTRCVCYDLTRMYSTFSIVVPGSEMRFKRVYPKAPLYDFFLSYTPDNKSNMERVRQLFVQHKKDLKFFTTENWNQSTSPQLTQEQIFNVMKTCTR